MLPDNNEIENGETIKIRCHTCEGIHDAKLVKTERVIYTPCWSSPRIYKLGQLEKIEDIYYERNSLEHEQAKKI